MMVLVHTQRARRLILMLVFAVMLVACGRDAERATASDLRITLIPAPEGATSDYLTVQVADAGGQPITDAVVSLEGNMNHAGMAPVFGEGVTDDADGTADGAYRVPFQFTMDGDWIITVQITRPGVDPVQQDIDLTISDNTVLIK
jgi:hypothetical protein